MAKKQNELGHIISQARKDLGISQRSLAKMTNMDNASISRIEAGKIQKPNILYLKSISEALNLSLAELMKLSGYNDFDINFGNNLSDKRSTKDYQNALEDYERFYFDVLEDIDMRRKNDMACKNILLNLIEKIEHPEFSKDTLDREKILEKLNEAFSTIKPNLEKFDKSKYPKYDRALFKDNFTNINTPKYNIFSDTNEK